jgi:hypothetical protein
MQPAASRQSGNDHTQSADGCQTINKNACYDNASGETTFIRRHSGNAMSKRHRWLL